MYTLTHIKPADYTGSQWAGGKTIQLAIAPPGAAYADRDFLWRVSSATVDLPTSDFTPLPNYERWIMPLTAPITLSHNGGEAISLKPFFSYHFDGSDRTCSAGCCTDFNLMVRKGAGYGHMSGISLSAGSAYIPKPPAALPSEFPAACAALIYCVSGAARFCAGSRSIDFIGQESLLIEGAVPSMAIHAMENDTQLAIACVYGKA